uniref:Transposase n=1 Tax=Steinernema glaseri TaxID=37863 RepID=A0A1I7YZ55_9BILA
MAVYPGTLLSQCLFCGRRHTRAKNTGQVKGNIAKCFSKTNNVLENCLQFLASFIAFKPSMKARLHYDA